MEKEKKKFNLSSLLRIYLGKKSKGLDCPSCRPPPTAGPAPPPGGAWTVKLSQIYLRGHPGRWLLGRFFTKSVCTNRGTAADELSGDLLVLTAAGKKKTGCWFADFLSRPALLTVDEHHIAIFAFCSQIVP